MKLKVDQLSNRRRVINPCPQTSHGDSIAQPVTFLFIILSLVCKSDIEKVLDSCPIRFFNPNVTNWVTAKMKFIDRYDKDCIPNSSISIDVNVF